MVNVEYIWYRGKQYRRYPESEHRSFRVYFRPTTKEARNGTKALHTEIWQDTHGQTVPPGHHVHHVDFNPLNNDPRNLVCLTHAEHMAAHATGQATEAQLEHLSRIRPMATEWHQSEDGRAWHREHARAVADAAVPRPATCTRCGASYMSKLPRLYCSNKCKAAARRASGADNVERACQQCGSMFSVNRYSKTVFCGKSCSATWQHAHR